MKHEKAFEKYFDHTLLKPEATSEQIQQLAEEAIAYNFASICVNGCYVKEAASYLAEHAGEQDVKVAAVVGFPLGAMSAPAKAAETRMALEDGASEIDMVIHIGAAKEGRWDEIRREIQTLARICHEKKAVLKVILEICLLTDEEIVSACRCAMEAEADFVKTSTGFSTGGATIQGVKLMRETVGDHLQVKAAGGLRTLADAEAMIEAGADRLGCSASVAVMKEYLNQ